MRRLHDEGRWVLSFELLFELGELAGKQKSLREKIVLLRMVLLHYRQILSHLVFVGQALDAWPLTQSLVRLDLL